MNNSRESCGNITEEGVILSERESEKLLLSFVNFKKILTLKSAIIRHAPSLSHTHKHTPAHTYTHTFFLLSFYQLNL
jgi:hypothetical protein